MSEKYNSMAFTPEEVKKGLHLKLLNTLLELNAEREDASYNDIHIWSDGYCTIIDWVDYNPEFGCGKFEFVDSDEYVMYEGQFPDNHIEMCWDEEDFNNRLKDWLKENPGWEKTEYGTWYNKKEQEAFRKMLEKQEITEETVEEAYNKLDKKQKKKAKEEITVEGLNNIIPKNINGAC